MAVAVVSFVIFVNGLVLIVFAALMGVDAVMFSETAAAFGASALLVGIVGVVLSLSTSSDFARLHRLHGFLLTSSVWMSGAIAGAVPLYLWSMSPVDAMFESMSGITTTGSTVMVGLDDTPRGVILWRAILQALGGVGFIVTGMALLPMLRVGGMQLFRTESSDKGEKELRNATMFASATLKIYLALIAACALTYRLGGMSAFDALTHAMTTLSTGGYSGYDASFGHFKSPFLQWSATLFMFLGCLPFVWYIRVWHRRVFGSEQIRAMLISLAMIIPVLTFWLMASRGLPFEHALRLVSFNVVSVVSTTGYATADYTLWGGLAVAVFLVLTVVGGCTGSTSGGVKAMRWLLLKRAIMVQMKRAQTPNRIVSVQYEGRPVPEDVLRGVIAFFMFFAVTFVAVTVTLEMLGLDLLTAASGALTALANVGPGVGPLIGPAGNFATLSDPAKIVLAFAMYLGRLEMLTVLVLMLPLFWREISA